MWSAGQRRLWHALSQRNLIGSDIAIILTCFQHFYQAGSFIATNDANGSIGMASLLMVFFSRPQLVAGILIVAATLAIIAEWQPDLPRQARFWMLFPQIFLLLIESLWAVHFICAQHYADGVPRSWNFIFCDQMSRLGMPLWYGSATLARVRD